MGPIDIESVRSPIDKLSSHGCCWSSDCEEYSMAVRPLNSEPKRCGVGGLLYLKDKILYSLKMDLEMVHKTV